MTTLLGWDKPDLDLLPEDQTQAIFGVGNRRCPVLYGL